MGTVEQFLGVHFTWDKTDNHLSVHLNQAGFARNLAKDLIDKIQCCKRRILLHTGLAFILPAFQGTAQKTNHPLSFAVNKPTNA